jgi:hypothetical protein
MMDCKFDVAVDLAYHITFPCVCPETGENIRHTYLEIARNFIKNTDCMHAKMYLREKLEMYSDRE